MVKEIAFFILILGIIPAFLSAQDRLPIIDVHLHAYIAIPPGESAGVSSWPTLM